ncbi:MAG: four helix bundle protein [Deltaproteobacteria bacterium]|nr:four helix bundle protein [Deltaproteobacteria bacterium]
MPLLLQWERTTQDILDRTARLPKAARFTFATRIDNIALDVMEKLTLARFAAKPTRAALLAEVDTALARLRVLFRLCHGRRLVDGGAYEVVARNLDEAGRMVGGWRQSLKAEQT